MSNEELAVLIKQGHTEYYSQLWVQVQYLMRKLAFRYYHSHTEQVLSSGVTVDDLIQESYMALVHAVSAYQPEKGYSLSTYFRFHLQKCFSSATGTRTQKQEPLNCYTSLETPLQEDDTTTMMDTITDDQAPEEYTNAENNIVNRQLHYELENILSRLKDQEREIVCAHYGRGKSLAEIGRECGRSRERIRQIAAQGMEKIRDPVRLRKLEQFIL